MTAITGSAETLATLSSAFFKTQDSSAFDRFLEKADRSDGGLSYQPGGPLSGSFDMSQSTSTLRDFRATNTGGTEYPGGPLSGSLPPSAMTSTLRDFMDHANAGVSSRSSVGTAICGCFGDRTDLFRPGPSSPSPSLTGDLPGMKGAKPTQPAVIKAEAPLF